MTGFAHVTVLRDEVVRALAPAAGEVHVDCTLGGGGHAEALLEAAPCRVIGIDRDADALAAATERLGRFGDRFRAVRGRFGDLGRVLDEVGEPQVDGVCADLGVSSPQLDRADRGFSFRQSGPLDMRMDQDAPVSAADVVNAWPEDELAAAIRDLGEEQRWRAVAKAIVAGRPWADTTALAGAIAKVVGRGDGRIHPATRTFQAIRMVVNDELGELDRLLTQLPDRLRPGGRAAIIAFHSLEDRAVKQFFARESARGTERDPYGHPVTPPRLSAPSRPVSADSDPNPRARSARLRSARRLPWPP